MADYELLPFGERAALVVFGQQQDPALNARVHALAERVRSLREKGAAIGAPVPAYSSLLVPYDPLALDFSTLTDLLQPEIEAAQPVEMAVSTEPVEIPTRYGGEDGPDLVEVAEYHGITPDEVIRLHTAHVYRVYMLGFAPGFAYLGPLPPQLETPRRATPRTRVPAGSVAIAGSQTGVYPLATPGGWRLIGRTSSNLWNPAQDPPALLRPGDFVRFKAV